MSNAATCGINKDGAELFRVDQATGQRLSDIDDRLSEDVGWILEEKFGEGQTFEVLSELVLNNRVATPTFFDLSTVELLETFVKTKLVGFSLQSVANLVSSGDLTLQGGHGSPSSDQRVGDIPYIKVSDLRAGSVNINATNLIPRPLAEKYWGEKTSGLQAYDLISPARTSKNIGDFCVLMPGQEQIVLTKEVFVLRAEKRIIDQFYLLWALTLEPVRAQWKRLVLMQTNREDVGDRVNELLIPVPPDTETGLAVSKPFRDYFEALRSAREELSTALASKGLPHRLTLGEIAAQTDGDYDEDE
jgi:hypothetical protein